ncbi:hydroxymethylglutaryl-CoA reductase [Aureobasidium pullulans]|nr:hydroxymethylglutaryl-CoA reductase [Aureobasidium pullulans]
MYAPLATVEPTLVASCSRGCKAFESNGGIHAVVLSEGMSRAPVFRFASPVDAVSFYRQIPGLEEELRCWAEDTSRFAKLEKVVPHLLGKDVHAKFVYSCGDASGQNMSTIATHKACQKLLVARGTELKIIDFQLEGQMASDKKFANIHVYEPRGVQVFAWGVLSDAVCKAVLGNSAARIHGALMVGQQGAIRAGMMGSNINVANILAAMFIACGQDAASVLESGWAQMTSEYDNEREELTLSLFIPSLLIGSVGGGTMYSTQKEALEMVKCAGDGRKWALAETMAAFALALDVSTLSSPILLHARHHHVAQIPYTLTLAIAIIADITVASGCPMTFACHCLSAARLNPRPKRPPIIAAPPRTLRKQPFSLNTND